MNWANSLSPPRSKPSAILDMLEIAARAPADLADRFLQFRQPAGIHRVALQDVIPQHLRRPDTELGASF